MDNSHNQLAEKFDDQHKSHDLAESPLKAFNQVHDELENYTIKLNFDRLTNLGNLNEELTELGFPNLDLEWNNPGDLFKGELTDSLRWQHCLRL